MSDRIRADQSHLWTENTNQNSKASATPVASVVERCKYLVSRRMRSENPKGYDNSNESKEME